MEKQELVERVGQSLGKIVEYLEAGADFAVEQAPLVAQEIITFGIFANSVKGLAAFVIFLVSFAVSLTTIRWGLNPNEDDEWGAVGCIVGALSLIPAYVSLFYFLEVSKALIAPRLYLIEKIGELL